MSDQPIRQYPDKLREKAETDKLRVFPPPVEPDDPTACSGEEGFCPEHGFHRHSLKQPGEPEDDTPAELTAEEARDLADDLGTQLYQAQDALAFVEECCVIAERSGRTITVADVRQWLKGAQCGRQSAAGGELAVDSAAPPVHLVTWAGPANNGEQCPRTTADNPATSRIPDLHQRLVHVVDDVFGQWTDGLGDKRPQDVIVAAILNNLLATGIDAEPRIPLAEQTEATLAGLYDDCDRGTEVIGELDEANIRMARDLARAEEQRDRLAGALHEVLGAFKMYWARASYCGPGEGAVQPEHFKAWRSVLQPTGHDTGPSVAECRRDNLRWPLESEGE